MHLTLLQYANLHLWSELLTYRLRADLQDDMVYVISMDVLICFEGPYAYEVASSGRSEGLSNRQ